LSVCVGEIISLPWFANEYSLGGGLRFQWCWCLGTSYLCVTLLLSNLIYLAFRELVSLRVGCVTT
jgi:hypothetical protein